MKSRAGNSSASRTLTPPEDPPTSTTVALPSEAQSKLFIRKVAGRPEGTRVLMALVKRLACAGCLPSQSNMESWLLCANAWP